jgi:glutathione S-transferase
MLPTLYAHPFSSYCQKVLIAFYEKDAAFELRLLSPENPAAGAELAALWPLGRFPVLVAEGRTLGESSVIIEWLDQRVPAPPRLIPREAEAALTVRMLDRVFDQHVMTPMQKIVLDSLRPEDARDPYGVAQARDLLDRAYRWLDGQLSEGKWAGGAEFSLADCAAAPALFYADWVQPLAAHAHLAAYLRRLRARPSFARAVDEARPYRPHFPGGAPAHAD